MNYEHYLFSKIWERRDKRFRELEYDLQWGSIFVEYDKFLKSKFENLETSLYDCIELYFADKYLINTKN
jgi:hypothetical protein